MTSEEVVSWCAACLGMEGGRDFIDSLLNMGAVVQRKNGLLAISSDVMYLLCLERYPVRKVSQFEKFDDLIELLAIALQHVDSVMLSKRLMANRRRTEYVFHHELFPFFRGMRAVSSISLSLPQSLGCGRCADIFLGYCCRTAFELVAGCVFEADIVACVAQADEYREQYHLDHMIVVNFVPKGVHVDTVYRVTEYPALSVVHVWYVPSCDEFVLEHESEEGEIRQWVVSTSQSVSADACYSGAEGSARVEHDDDWTLCHRSWKASGLCK